MIKFKDYNWFMDGLAALVLLVAFVLMLIYRTEVSDMAIRLTGLGVLFFTLIRIRPILQSRNDKDYVLVMFSEMLISLVVGIILLVFTTKLENDNLILSFGTLMGIVLYVRGIVHFWTTAKRYELHDIIAFIFHILFISFGFLFILTDFLSEEKIALFLMIISVLLSVFFGYRTYKGYNRYRIQKMNSLKVNNYLDKQKETTVEDPVSIEEKINPKVIDEPKDEKRAPIDIN